MSDWSEADCYVSIAPSWQEADIKVNFTDDWVSADKKVYVVSWPQGVSPVGCL